MEISRKQYLGKCIQYYRKRQGVSQSALASKLGVRPSTVSKWEAGYCDSLEAIEQLAVLLDVNLLNAVVKRTNPRIIRGWGSRKPGEKHLAMHGANEWRDYSFSYQSIMNGRMNEK